ncbi:MAG: DnaB-like helicase N-terminal domain-containing protein [Aliarcobacter sp.]|nr:DnaB-like helicase N-terminal domain-containing protein [Aliarcobacter sp.]
MIDNLADKDLEQIILSTCIQSERYLEVSEIILEKHFTEEAHKAIWKTLKIIEDKNIEISPQMMAVELMKNTPEHMGMLKLILLKTAMPNLTILAVELIEWFNKRELYKLSIQIQESLSSKKSSSLITKEIDDVTNGLDQGIGTRAKSYAQWEIEKSQKAPIPKYETSISFVDSALKGGIGAGQFILLMGDPEAGKTVLGTQILRNVVKNNHLALFFSFEFTVDDFIDQNQEKKREFPKENLQIINDGYDIADVSREIKLWARKGCRFILIDSQMRVENSDNRGTAEQSESEKFSKLAKLCHSLNIIIIFITQQGKEDTKGGTHTPMGTKKGAHEANQIWYIHKQKPKYDEDGNDLNKEMRDFEISKNKQNGRHFKAPIRLDTVILEFLRKYNHQEATFESDNQPKKKKFIPGPKGSNIEIEIEEGTKVDVPDIF